MPLARRTLGHLRSPLLSGPLVAAPLLAAFACTSPASTDKPADTADTADGTNGGDTSGGDTSGSTLTPGRYFPDGAPWYQDVTDAAVDPTSDAVIGWLQDAGWGYGRMQTDFSLEVVDGDASAPFLPFTPVDGYFYAPDCDTDDVPVPEGGTVEGENGYTCTGGGDCHLLVPYWPENKLYEMWKADIRGDRFRGGCLAVWDMTRVYGPDGRGMQCTSADAAGFPITPLLFTADEVAAGKIDHAIRFILPNENMRQGVFVAPATHAGAPSADSPAPPYGAHLRLRADYPLDTLPNDGARTVARALQTYGMFLADGGNITLTARSDRFTEHKWADVLGSHDMEDLQPSDFELLDAGDPIELTYDCQRTE